MKNVIFDFGNVIIRWSPFQALGHLFQDETDMTETLHKIGFFDWNLEQDRGRSWPDGLALVKREKPQHAHIFEAYYKGLGPAHNRLVPGTSEIIQALNDKGVNLFGLTNASLETVAVVRDTAPVLNLMKDIVISAAAGVIKPNAEIYELCLSRNGLQAVETLFVDDSLANCEAAQKLGIGAHHFVNAKGLSDDLISRGVLS